MTLSRYAAFDAYMHEQLRRDLAASTPKEQINLIKGFLNGIEFQGKLRDAIGQWVVAEGPLEVCQWFARNVYLSDDEAMKLRSKRKQDEPIRAWKEALLTLANKTGRRATGRIEDPLTLHYITRHLNREALKMG